MQCATRSHHRGPQHGVFSSSPFWFSVFTDSVSLAGTLAAAANKEHIYKRIIICTLQWHRILYIDTVQCSTGGTRCENKIKCRLSASHQEIHINTSGASRLFDWLLKQNSLKLCYNYKTTSQKEKRLALWLCIAVIISIIYQVLNGSWHGAGEWTAALWGLTDTDNEKRRDEGSRMRRTELLKRSMKWYSESSASTLERLCADRWW